MTRPSDRFPTDTAGLPPAVAPETHEVQDEDRFELRIGPVAKRVGEATLRMLAYNGSIPGPTLRVRQGSEVELDLINEGDLEATVHWHGLPVPSGMDGVGGLSQRTIETGETFRYEFVLTRPGTFMYHSHHDEMVQMAMGLMGMFVVHPRAPAQPPPDRDYAYMLSEWAIPVGAARPDPNEMTDFNVLTMNGKAFPGTTPIVARQGERVRIRVQLVSANSDETLWADRYDRDLKDVLGLQSEVAETVAKEIALQLTPRESAQLAQRPAVNAEAHVEYLKALHLSFDASPQAITLAMKHLDRVFALDPTFAPAWATLAGVHLTRASRGMAPPAEADAA